MFMSVVGIHILALFVCDMHSVISMVKEHMALKPCRFDARPMHFFQVITRLS